MKTTHYDIILITFSKPSRDARLINILKNICDKKSVCVLGFDDKAFSEFADKIKCAYIPVFLCTGRRMLFRWRLFNKRIRRYRQKISADTILAADMYSLPAASGLKQKGGRLLYDSREIYSALGSLHKASLKQFVISNIEKHYMKFVDEMIVSGEMDAEYLKGYFKHDLPYHILMNLPPFKEIVQSNYLRDEFKIAPEKKIILYQGALINGRGIEIMMEAVRLIDNAVLCLLGAGPAYEQLEEMISKQNLYGKVILCGVHPYEKLHEITCSADVGTAFFEPVSFSYQLALPNKLFEYMMAGLPVLASDLPAVNKVYQEFPFGVLAATRSTTIELAEHLKMLLDNIDSYKPILKNAAQKYNYDNQKQIVLDMFIR